MDDNIKPATKEMMDGHGMASIKTSTLQRMNDEIDSLQNLLALAGARFRAAEELRLETRGGLVYAEAYARLQDAIAAYDKAIGEGAK